MSKDDSGDMLEYASEDLSKDKEIVLVAVRSSGCALEFASKNLKKNDREIVEEAMSVVAHILCDNFPLGLGTERIQD